MWIMVAGPYRTGAMSNAEREAAGADAYDAIMMPLSLALADRCDAVLRLDGASAGADAEVERVRARGGMVYRSVEEVPDAPSR